MVDKVILIICDGLGDRPIKELHYLTPLESAKTPNLDWLAKQSECGMMHTLGRGTVPGSDVAHLAIMGYDYTDKKIYSGRGPIEVAGIDGIDLQEGDVALRGNFATVDETLIIVDRRAGRIKDVAPLTEELDGKIELDGVRFIVKPGTAHRAVIIMRGKGLSHEIIDSDPHEENLHARGVTPRKNAQKLTEAERTSDILNQFLTEAHGILDALPFNRTREKRANYLLLRGAGQYNEVPSFKKKYGLSACCIAGGGLYKGIGAYLGMKVINVSGATGLPDTDIEAKFQEAVAQLENYQFVFVHVKAADSLGEDGNFEGKKNFIEKIDCAAHILSDLPEEVLLVITADHSTPSELKRHSGDPVPIMFMGTGVRVDSVSAFDERACTAGGLGFIEGQDLIPQIRNLLDLLPLTGA